MNIYWIFWEFRRVLAFHGRALLAGLPALVAGLAALCLAVQVAISSDDVRSAHYLRVAQERAEARDFATAEICYEHLIQDAGPRPDLLFPYAMSLKGKGNRAEAESIFARLAPIDHPGYVPAHLEMARALFGRRERSARTLRALEVHLKIALEGSPWEAAEAGFMLGQLYAATGRGEQAERYLLKAVDQQPEMLLLLARLAHERGNKPLAQERAERATGVFRRQTEARFDDVKARILWATSLVYRSEFAAAAAVLERGLKLTDDYSYRTTLGQVYAAWEADLATKTEPATGERVALIERGLAYDPNSGALLDRLSSILQSNNPAADGVRTTLRKLLADGKVSAGIHLVLGNDASARGQHDEARLHWEQALQIDPQMAVVANNLAWVFAHANPPDLPRALELVNQALARRPDSARFRGTRGIVFLKLQRWRDALTDLEAELVAFPNRQGTHQALAEVYDHLGAPELAAEHRTRANPSKKPAPPTAKSSSD